MTSSGRCCASLKSVQLTFKSYSHFCICSPLPDNCYLIPVNTMSTPLESGSGIVVQAPINVPLPTYDCYAPDQMWEFQLFKHQFTSWKEICQIMSDEVDYLLSILGKEGYAAMNHWMLTDPTDKNDVGRFQDYLEITLMMRYLPVLESMSRKMSRQG